MGHAGLKVEWRSQQTTLSWLTPALLRSQPVDGRRVQGGAAAGGAERDDV